MKLLLRNRWFWSLLLLFSLHQILEKGLDIRVGWVDNYLDDLLCMPILLSGWLAEQYDLFGKKRLQSREIVALWLLVSIIFEGVLPGLSPEYTADIWDMVCYGLGSGFFYCVINPLDWKTIQHGGISLRSRALR